jgi:outer membrane immunogenic protein
MRRISLAVMVTTALTVAALSAGIQSASAASATYNWSGWYLGLNAGGAWGKSDTTRGNDATFVPSYQAIVNGAGTQSQSPKGFVGGAQAGYNNQNGMWVVGIETDFQAFGLKNTLNQTNNDPAFPGFPIISSSEIKTDWLFTARPRLGIAQNNVLIYGTGGIAVTKIKFNQFFNFPGNAITESASVSQTKTGWTFGGGLEWAWMKNWSIKAEYLYVKFGSVSANGAYTGGQAATPIHTADLKANIARIGINYKFGGP